MLKKEKEVRKSLFFVVVAILFFFFMLFSVGSEEGLKETGEEKALLEEELQNLTQQLAELGYNLSSQETLMKEYFNISSILVENFSCNTTGYETSKVLQPGKHTLQFAYGDCWLDKSLVGQVDKAGPGCIIAYAYNQVEENTTIIFDRDLECHKCGKHKAPPLTNVNMTISAIVSSALSNATLTDYYPIEWSVTDANQGIVSSYNSTYNKIEWNVISVNTSVTKSYIIKSPALTTPPTKYYFQTELAGQKSDPWMVIVADPSPVSDYLYICGNDDFCRQVDTANPESEILNWDTETSYPFGATYRDDTDYLYVGDYGVDSIIEFNKTNGTEMGRWGISGYSGDIGGLGSNGTHFIIADLKDDKIYFATYADPTTSTSECAYIDIGVVEGVAFDGTYLWVVDSGLDKVLQINYSCDIQTSWSFSPLDPVGIAYDSRTGNLWIVSSATGSLYEYTTTGTLLNTYANIPGATPEGVAYELYPSVVWNQSTLNLGIGEMGIENISGLAEIEAVRDNANVAVTCDSGNCSEITHNWTTANIADGDIGLVNFTCNTTTYGEFSAIFNVISTQ